MDVVTQLENGLLVTRDALIDEGLEDSVTFISSDTELRELLGIAEGVVLSSKSISSGAAPLFAIPCGSFTFLLSFD